MNIRNSFLKTNEVIMNSWLHQDFIKYDVGTNFRIATIAFITICFILIGQQFGTSQTRLCGSRDKDC